MPAAGALSSAAPGRARTTSSTPRIRTAERRDMRCILHGPSAAGRARRLTETLQQLCGVLEACALGRQLPRDAQPQRAIEAVFARAFLHQTHHRRRIDRRALLEQYRAALRSEIEPPHAEGARGELQP